MTVSVNVPGTLPETADASLHDERVSYDDTVAALRSIVESIAIQGDASFTVAGRPGRLADPAAGAVPGAPPPASPLEGGLIQEIYGRWYCRQAGPERPHPAADEDLLPALSAANAGRPRWEPGWTVSALLPGGAVAVAKAGRSRLAQPGELVTWDGPGVPPRPGSAASLQVAVESTTYQQGFYFAFGETLAGRADETDWVRLYWHVRADGAAPLLAGLSARLNRYQVPFRLKLLRLRSMYVRPDAAVLYVGRRHFQAAAALAAEVHAAVAGALRPQVGLFVKKLAPGLGVAEDPGNGESFGWQRCRLVAEGLIAARRRGIEDAGERLAALLEHLRQAGVDPARPHLTRSLTDFYEVPNRRAA